MSFLYYDDAEPLTKALFKAVRAKELYVWDEPTQQYIPVTAGGGGGGGEVPYWVKPNAAQIGSPEGKQTILTQDELEINSTVDITGSSLSSSALTLGDTTGNHILNKDSIDAANRVKNITLDAAPTGKKMLLYDSTNKNLTYKDQYAPPYWVQSTAANFVNGASSTWLESNYLQMIGNTAKTFIDSDNISFTKNNVLNFELLRNYQESEEIQMLWKDASENVTSYVKPNAIKNKKLILNNGSSAIGALLDTVGIRCGTMNSSDGFAPSKALAEIKPESIKVSDNTRTRSAYITPTDFQIINNGNIFALNSSHIYNLNQISNAVTVANTTGYSMLVKNTSNGAYNLAAIPSGTAPAWAKTNSIDSLATSGGGTTTISANKGELGNIDLDNSTNSSQIRLNGVLSSLDITKPGNGGSTDSASLTITDVQITNKLKAITRIATTENLPSTASNTIQNEVCYNPITKNFAFRALEGCVMDDASRPGGPDGRGGLVALTRTGGTGPHDLLEPNAVADYGVGANPDMKRYDLKNKLLMQFTGCYNVWYCVSLSMEPGVDADRGAVKATLCPTERADSTGTTQPSGPAVLYTCLLPQLSSADNLLVPNGSFAFKIYNPSINDSTTRMSTRILFERVCTDFDTLGFLTATNMPRQA